MLYSNISDSSPNINQAIPPQSSTTRNQQSASLRVGNYMGHAAEMLNHLEKQNSSLGIEAEKLALIYTRAHEQVQLIDSRLERTIQSSDSTGAEPLSKREIKELKHLLKSAEKEITKIIQKTQAEVAIELQTVKNDGNRVEVSPKLFSSLEAKGLKDKFIRLLALVSSTHRFAVAAFDAMQPSNRPLSNATPLTQVETDKVEEFKKNKGDLNRRAGVIGLNGIYHFQALFSKNNIQNQFKSFIAQNLSQRERRTIEREMTINGASCKSLSVPLNKEFDTTKSSEGRTITVFKDIFGTGGISSANRQEAHLINGWESNLISNETKIFTAIRHAITSDKYEKDPKIRKDNSIKAAEELLKAALLQEIAAQGLTLEEAKKKGISLNFNSVSLVTPDSLRQYIPGQDDEQRMLNDQISALKSFENSKETTSFNLDGFAIPVKVKVNAFNFGVNTGAVNFGLGLKTQYEHNKAALEGVQSQCRNLINIVLEKQDSITPELEKQIQNSLLLLDDINTLMQDEKSYLQGDNQYEIGAKILNLTNVMSKITELVNEETGDNSELISGFKAAFNCMSGKDRTGFLDAVAKTFALMAEANQGAYPSHKALMEDKMVREQFITILKTVLLESGGLEITEINTGAKGYKVGKEARILGMDPADFLDVQGLSSTTSS